MTGQSRVRVAVPSIAPSRVSGFIADHLRRQIIRGQLTEGDALPPESELTAEWGVSRSTLREAFRILESESLITVRRGARGGARVTTPPPQVAARHVGHLLQYRGVTVGEIARAAIVIQPRAAFLLAERRPADVLETLDVCLKREAEYFDDPVAFGHRSLEFGRALTDGCGDQMLKVFGEVLFYLRSGTVDSVMMNHFGGNGLQVEGRKAIQWVHRRQQGLVDRIRAGEPARAEEHWRAFLEEQLHSMPDMADQLAYDAWAGATSDETI